MKKSILVPVVTILAAAAILFGLAFGLAGVANANAQANHLEMMQTLLPGSENFTLEAYDGDDANIVSVHKAENGFVIETCTYGYAGEITMHIAVSNEGKVMGLVVQDMEETPWLHKLILKELILKFIQILQKIKKALENYLNNFLSLKEFKVTLHQNLQALSTKAEN